MWPRSIVQDDSPLSLSSDLKPSLPMSLVAGKGLAESSAVRTLSNNFTHIDVEALKGVRKIVELFCQADGNAHDP